MQKCHSLNVCKYLNMQKPYQWILSMKLLFSNNLNLKYPKNVVTHYQLQIADKKQLNFIETILIGWRFV